MTITDARIFELGDYRIDVIVHGFPGKSVCHGPLGFSTIALVRHKNKVALIDVGGFGQRLILLDRLKELGITPESVTDILLTHSHFDHAINWVAFPEATIYISAEEMDWAKSQPRGRTYVPELYVEALSKHDKLKLIANGDTGFPGIRAIATPGHTPGSLVFVLDAGSIDVVFTGDACKNRAELMSRSADMTFDKHATEDSIKKIWAEWKRRENGVLIPGHDLPMIMRNEAIQYIGSREAAIKAWYSDDLNKTTIFSLL